MTKKTQQTIVSIFIYLFVFILMMEWLKPVIDLTDTGFLALFGWFLMISFAFYLLKLKWVYAFPVKVVYICWVIVHIYTDLSFLSLETFKFIWGMFVENIVSLLTQDWVQVTNPFRTFLFFILLWMTTYLLNYWIRIRKNLMVFFLFTVIFITILDTFSPYSGEKSIVIVLTSGFIILGLLYTQKIMHEQEGKLPGAFLVACIGSLLSIVVLSSAIAYALPKAGPSWPDPVPFLLSTSPNASNGDDGRGLGGAMQKVGYGENDERLGGAFADDDTPVFYATTPTKQYWKIETKDTYTSKGWVNSPTESPIITIYKLGEPIKSDIAPGTEDESLVAKILMSRSYPFIMQPYGIEQVDSEQPVTLSLNERNQKLNTFNGADETPVGAYNVTYNEPTYSLKALRETVPTNLEGLPSEFDRYLQLPKTLPTRVKDLATSITSDSDSLYDKAKAIERYFRLNGFSYNQDMVAVPDGDTDYVDQFLFDTKVGYCDNFSTSMVVLLRSEGIPARWVKGFASGEVIERQNGLPVYEVTNNNAHSWVEAYFPNVGWMTFEPTIGFSNAVNLNYDIDTEADELETPENTPEETPKKTPSDKEEKEVSKSFTEIMSTIAKWISDNKALIFWTIVGLALLSMFAYRHRRKWLSKILIPVNRMRKNDWDTFEKMYHQLLKQLDSYGIKREQGQTLSAYAKYVDANFGETHMRKLTAVYEKGLYGNNRDGINYEVLRESWENLINQLSG
ncbi:transglutaminase domain-containing protein [Psychrobacillus antarcticus]|uniref:transglutaminase domain-containing protein n=1 Tax=Psychrobacillus antarcticus TaxID=2879115 RepID=UPI0024078B44|nr:transglutaminase domain-containing protein [Psychrobacillus antarcticus]